MNVLVFVHGLTPDVAPSDPRSLGGTYDKFWKALQAHKPELRKLFPDGPILVEWGHQLSPTENPVREDRRIIIDTKPRELSALPPGALSVASAVSIQWRRKAIVCSSDSAAGAGTALQIANKTKTRSNR